MKLFWQMVDVQSHSTSGKSRFPTDKDDKNVVDLNTEMRNYKRTTKLCWFIWMTAGENANDYFKKPEDPT
jgi:hypothetical protein